MSLDNRLAEIHSTQAELQRMQEQILNGGNGSNGGSGMEIRVARLESQLDKVGEQMTGVRVNLATLTERVGHLPSKGFIVTANLTAIALIAALLTFGDKICALVS
ncbi:hypothetical protein [Croceicoccus sp. YJ47]|uniref:hypothetical protein n=1 Tax=Croceicoccus sp. YJ47 TaxID=2798724 RepID=UPI001922D4E9|nr:hypothetical protein [Croceicoccus sp. YJ47]QQN73154.1 hypothetical protein JD971_09755 [Croceicoccus sp. YJ47]